MIITQIDGSFKSPFNMKNFQKLFIIPAFTLYPRDPNGQFKPLHIEETKITVSDIYKNYGRNKTSAQYWNQKIDGIEKERKELLKKIKQKNFCGTHVKNSYDNRYAMIADKKDIDTWYKKDFYTLQQEKNRETNEKRYWFLQAWAYHAIKASKYVSKNFF